VCAYSSVQLDKSRVEKEFTDVFRCCYETKHTCYFTLYRCGEKNTDPVTFQPHTVLTPVAAGVQQSADFPASWDTSIIRSFLAVVARYKPEYTASLLSLHDADIKVDST